MLTTPSIHRLAPGLVGRIQRLLSAWFDGLMAFAERRAARRRSAKLVLATELALSRLDSRGLHDLGLSRGQISSIAIEVAEQAESARTPNPSTPWLPHSAQAAFPRPFN